jgi:hypothetical protein
MVHRDQTDSAKRSQVHTGEVFQRECWVPKTYTGATLARTFQRLQRNRAQTINDKHTYRTPGTSEPHARKLFGLL